MSAISLVYPVIILFVKCSIILLYIRIFGVNRKFRYWAYGGMFIQMIYYLAYFGFLAANSALCSDPTDQSHEICKDTPSLTIASGILNVLTDVFMLILPLPLTIRLQLRARQKLGVLLIFGAGLGCVPFIDTLYHTNDATGPA